MSNEVEQVKKAFAKARIEGAKLLEAGIIDWESYEFTMIGFELKLKSMGVSL